MRLYIACQTRGGDLDQFFSHEIQAVPPALSCGGKQRIGTKADLLHCFESCVASKPQSTPEVDAIILDSAVAVHMLHHATANHFKSMHILCLDHICSPRLLGCVSARQSQKNNQTKERKGCQKTCVPFYYDTQELERLSLC